MLSKIPIDIGQATEKEIEREVLRAALIAELDAINLYEQMATLVKDQDIKKVLLDVAKEEKEHVGEFQTMLLRYDQEQVEEMEEGKREIEEMVGK